MNRTSVERGLDLFRDLIDERPALRAELDASAAEFFRGPAPEGPDAVAVASARRRHLEWFLFERPTGRTGEFAAEALLDDWRARAGEELAGESGLFFESQAGIFEVSGVEPGEGAWLRDLAGLGEYPACEPEASQVFDTGDLVVGRLYPLGDGEHAISSGAGFFRSPELRAAVERDLERLREQRVHPVLRVAQSELEAMFWGATAPAEQSDPVEAARRFLVDSGLSEDQVRAILEALRASPLDPEVITPGLGGPLTEVLELLAFDTEVDLERARRVLIAAWSRLSLPAEPDAAAGEPPARCASPDDVRRALERFDEERAAGVDLDRAIGELARSLGVEEETEPGEVLEDAPDFPGVVAAVIEEFLWEVGASDGPEAARALEPLRQFGAYAAHVGVIENLAARDLAAFANLWLPERGVLRSPEEARAMVRALRRFVGWLAEAQSVDLAGEQDRDLAELEEALPRITAANRRLGAAGREEPTGALLEVLSVDPRLGLRVGDAGGEQDVLHVEAGVARDLRAGDRVRLGSKGELARCYPAQAARLVEA